MVPVSSKIGRGILNIPGSGLEAKATAEQLLAKDRETYHCFYGKLAFHNHLSHHILAAFDLGAPVKLLEAIYEAEKLDLSPLHLSDRKTNTVEPQNVEITTANWVEYIGDEKYYASLLAFFTMEVERLGEAKVLETYVFSPKANEKGADMLSRLITVHALIQVGYALEFDSPAMLAQGLAQTAVSGTLVSSLPPDSAASTTHTNGHPSIVTNECTAESISNSNVDSTVRHSSDGPSLLLILRKAYDSPILKPVMPYDPDALLSKRRRDMAQDGRPEEIQRLSNLWLVDEARGDAHFNERVEEIIWLATLLFAGTSKPGRKPRLDFFLMHILNATLFLPSYMRAINNPADKARLLRAMVPIILTTLILRGRPRIDPALLMSYSAYPRPPSSGDALDHPDALGDPQDASLTNPWPAIFADVLHAPDAHTIKAVRILYYAAQRFQDVPPGGAIGAFDENWNETHKGTAAMDGTIFIRAAGVVMDRLGWVTHGQNAGRWDSSALGWDDAWKGKE